MDAEQARSLLADRFNLDLRGLVGRAVQVTLLDETPTIAVFRGLLVDERGDAGAVVDGREPGMLIEVHPSRILPAPLVPAPRLDGGWIALDPTRSRLWAPDEVASEEIETSDDAAAKVLQLCTESPERGVWERL